MHPSCCVCGGTCLECVPVLYRDFTYCVLLLCDNLKRLPSATNGNTWSRYHVSLLSVMATRYDEKIMQKDRSELGVTCHHGPGGCGEHYECHAVRLIGRISSEATVCLVH